MGENKMDKIAKMEIAKKGLIYLFVLIALIIVTYLVSGFYGAYNPYFLSSLNTLITMVFVMVIFAVSIKYIVDIAIVKAERE